MSLMFSASLRKYQTRTETHISLSLIEHISEENVCTLLHLADTFNAAYLKEACLDRIMR